jgi:hypothetical protein
VVVFADQPVSVLEVGVVRSHPVLWAFGILADGQCEVLGAWGQPMPSGWGGAEVIADLTHRGVEEIRFVSGIESRGFHANFEMAYPGATALPEVWRLWALFALPSRYRSVAHTSADSMHHLQLRANRAVSRHGSFCCVAGATLFVMDALNQADQDIELAGVRGVSVSEASIALDTRSFQPRPTVSGF